jgi:tropomyosin
MLERDQDITSLNHKLSVLEADLEKAESKNSELKKASGEGESARTTADGLQRKIQLLEEELDAAEKNVKDTVEKSVSPPASAVAHPR